MKNKVITSFLIVGLIIIVVAGITYAIITWTSPTINISSTSDCFKVLYAKGTNIGSDQNAATLTPSDSYTGGLSTTVKIGFSSSCTNINGSGTITLNTLSTTSENLFREGLLKYAVLKNGTKIEEGNITSTNPIDIEIGTLKKVSNVSSADSYQVYVWINKVLVTNADAFSNYYGNITASVEQIHS